MSPVQLCGNRPLTKRIIARFLWALFFVFSLFLAGRSTSALSAGGAGALPAQPDPGIKYSDSWFIYGLDVGESREDVIRVQNTSDEEQTFKLYAVDSVATGDGNFSLQSEDHAREGVGAWVTLDQSQVTLGPREERDVRFTITVPANASVGEHSGGIIIQKAQAPAAGEGQAGASIITRLGIRIYETVPGEIVRSIALGDFTIAEETPKEGKPIYRIQLSAQNNSNVSLVAKATLAISGWGKLSYFPNSRFQDGLYLDFSDFSNFFKGDNLGQEWQLLRNQNVITNWEWPKPVFGKYRFRARLTYDTPSGIETLVSRPIDILVVPWTELGVFLALLFALVGLALIQGMRGGARGWHTYYVQPGDQLATIAERVGLSWKKLAKVNKLKKPVVHPGQAILLPKIVPSVKAALTQSPAKKIAVRAAPKTGDAASHMRKSAHKKKE